MALLGAMASSTFAVVVGDVDHLPDDPPGIERDHPFDHAVVFTAVDDDGVKPETRVLADDPGGERGKIGAFLPELELLLQAQIGGVGLAVGRPDPLRRTSSMALRR
jgi:hypothetical protein